MKKQLTLFLGVLFLVLTPYLKAEVSLSAPLTVPYSNDFSTNPFVNDWSRSGDQSDMTLLSTDNWEWASGTLVSGPGYGTPLSSQVYTLTSPLIHIGVAGADLSFDYQKKVSGSRFAVYVLDQGTRYPLVANLSVGELYSLTSYEVSLSSYLNKDIQLVFEHSNIQGDCVLDNISIVEPPICPTAKHLSVSQLTATALTLHWDNTIADNYKVLVTTAVQTDPSSPQASDVVFNATVPVSATLGAYSYSVTGLTGGTTYYLYVQSDCSSISKDMGAWSTYIMTKTPCSAVAVPYLQDFESYAEGQQPDCWNILSETKSVSSVKNGLYTDTNKSKYFALGSDGVHATMMVFPLIDEDIETLMIEFRGKTSLDSMNFSIGITDDISSTDGVVALDSKMMYKTWKDYTFFLSNPVFLGKNHYIVIYLPSGLTDNTSAFYAFFDDINISVKPSCFNPIDLQVGQVSDTQATLSWNDINGTPLNYTIEYTPEGGTPQSVTTTSSPYTITGLTQNQRYSVRMRTNCTATDHSIYSDTTYFQTIFTPEHVDASTPVREDFEGPTTKWHFENGLQSNQWALGEALSSSPSHSVYISGDFGTTLGVKAQTQSFVNAYCDYEFAVAGSYRFEFNWAGKGSSYKSYLKFYKTSTGHDLSAGSVLYGPEVTQIGTTYASSKNHQWEHVSIIITVPSPCIYRMVGQWYNSGYVSLGDYVAFDDVTMTYINCENPANFGSTSIGSTSANLVWNGTSDSYTTRAYKRAVSLDSIDAITPELTQTSTTSNMTMTGFDGGSHYYIYLQGHCGTYKSEWIGPLEIETECLPKALPYSEDFSGYADYSLPNCFDSNAPDHIIILNTPQFNYSIDGTPNLRIIGSTTSDDFLYLPQMADPINTLMVECDYKAESADYTNDLVLGYITDITDTSTFVRLKSYDKASGKVQHILVDYTTFPDTASGRLCFKMTPSLSSGTPNGGVIDHLHVFTKPTCMPVMQVYTPEASDTQVTLAWNVLSSSPRSFVVEYGPKDFVEGTGTTLHVSDTTCVITGLSPLTQYTARVAVDCGSTEGSSLYKEVSFVTRALSADATNYSCDFEVAAENLNWSLPQGVSSNNWSIGSLGAKDGANGLYVVDKNAALGYTGNNATNVWASRIFNCTAGQYIVEYDYMVNGENTSDFLQTFIVPSAFDFRAGDSYGAFAQSFPAGWMTGSATYFSGQTSWQHESFTILLNKDQAVTLAFHWRNDMSQAYLPGAQIDNVTFKKVTCNPAYNFVLTEVGSTTAKIDWNALAFSTAEVRVSTVPHTEAELNDAATAWVYSSDTQTTTTLDLSSLESNTTYYLYIRNVCSATDKAFWSEGFTFKTTCGIKSIPYITSFTAGSDGQVPECWTNLGYDGVTISSRIPKDHGGRSLYFNLPDATTGTIALPLLDMRDGVEKYKLEFYAMRLASNLPSDIEVAVMGAESLTGERYLLQTDPIHITSATNSSWAHFVAYFEHPIDILTGAPMTLSNEQYVILSVSGKAEMFVDSLSIERMPDCSAPYNLVLDTAKVTTATLHWESQGGTTELRAINKTLNDTMFVTTTAKTITLTGLQAHSLYEVRARTLCTTGPPTVWTPAVTFTTDCGVEALPFLMDFNQASWSVVDLCWTSVTTNQSYKWIKNHRDGGAADDYEREVGYWYASSSDIMVSTLTSPTISLIGQTNGILSFEYKSDNTLSSMRLSVVVKDETSHTIDTITPNVILNTDWTLYEQDLSAYVGHEIKLAFCTHMKNATGYIHLDNVKLEDRVFVPMPLSPSVTGITENSAVAHVGHIDGLSTYQVGLVKNDETFYPSSARLFSITANDSVNMTGLLPATSYKMYVQSQIGANSSSWTGPVLFTTDCSAFNVPIIEDFDKSNGTVPMCWTAYGVSISSYNMHSGQYAAYIPKGKTLVSPKIEAMLSTLELFVNAYTFSPYTILEVGVMTDPSDLSTMTPMDTIASSDVYPLENVDFTAEDGTNHYIYFKNVGAVDAYLDDINIMVRSTCRFDETVSLGGLKTGEACIRMSGAGSSYDILWGEPGTIDFSTATPQQTAVPDSTWITGLSSNTAYEVYVRTNCGAGSTSRWNGPFAFTSGCSAYTVTPASPFLEDLSAYTASDYGHVPACWSQLNSSGTYVAPYAFVYAYYSSSYLKMSSSETDTVFAIAPEVTNALNSLIFQFKIKTTMGYAMNYTSTDDYVTIGSMSNPSDASTFVPYSHVDLSSLPSYGYGTYTFDARYYNIPASHHNFAIRVSNSKDAYCIDDIEMISAGGCGVPQLSVGVTTDHSAELHILHTPSTSTLQIAVRSADHSYNDTTSILSDSLSVLTGLTANTEYFATIRGICASTTGNDTSAWIPEVNFFTTGVPHLGFPYYCDFEEDTENSAWSLFTGGLSNYWTVGTAVLGRKEGSHGLYISEDGLNASFNTSAETFTWATRMIHFTPGAYTIAFKAKAGGTTGEDYMRAFLVESDQHLLPCAPSLSSRDDFNGVTLTSTTTPAGFLDLLGVNQSISNKDWQEYTYELLVTEEKDYQLAYLWVNNAYYGIQPGGAVDSISIALNTCAQPSGVKITYAGARNLKAIATGVEDDASIVLRFGVMPKDVPMDTSSFVSTRTINQGDTANLTGLSPYTAYDLYCTRVCDGVSAEWLPKVTVMTTMESATTPYTCGFEPGGAETLEWRYYNAAHNEWIVGTDTAFTGNQALYISDNKQDNEYYSIWSSYSYALRTVHFEPGSYSISFNWKGVGELNSDYMMLFVAPGNFFPTAGNGMINGTMISPTMAKPLDTEVYGVYNNSINWTNTAESLIIDHSCNMNIIFAWVNDGSGGSNPPACVDDLIIQAETCPAPLHVTLSDITASGAQVSWTTEAAQSNLQVIDLSSMLTVLDTTIDAQTFPVTGLKGGASYRVQVSSVCSADDASIHTRPIEFTTPCGVNVLPYSEAFLGQAATPNCWEQFTGLASSTGVTSGDGLSTPYYGGWSHTQIPEAHDYVVINGTNKNAWLVSPEMELNANSILTFKAAFTNYGTMDAPLDGSIDDDRFVVMISHNHGSTWTELSSWDQSQVAGHQLSDLSNSFSPLYVPILTDLAHDTIQLAFYGESTVTGGDNALRLNTMLVNTLSADTVYVSDTTCQGEDYNAYGFNLKNVVTGQYTKVGPKPGETDVFQVTILDLWTNPSYAIDTAVTICHGQYYSFNGKDLNQSGVYRMHHTTRLGCDSVVNLSLYVYLAETKIDTVLCEGQTITLGSTVISSAGVYTDTLITPAGCDSVVKMAVSFIPTNVSVAQTICEGDFVELGTSRFTTSGHYTETLQNRLGCDSIVTLDLTVIPSDSVYTAQVCHGSEYNFFGTMLSTSGFYTDTVHNYQGSTCDHIYKLTLVETAVDTVEYAGQFCEGATSYNEFGFSINNPETQDYTRTLTSAVSGCDSVTILHLSEVKAVYSKTSQTICDGESVHFGNKDLYTSGVYSYTFSALSTGCDSIVELTLNVNPTYEETVAVSVAQNKLPYTNLTLTVPKGTELGTYDYTINAQTEAGCDSTIYLTLTVTKADGLSNVLVNDLTLLPNVVKKGGQVFLQTSFSPALREGMDIRLYDALGRLITTYKPTLSGRMSFSMPFDSGLYFMRISTQDGQVYSGKVVVI